MGNKLKAILDDHKSNKPKYKVGYGRTLKNEDYEGYSKKIEISGKIEKNGVKIFKKFLVCNGPISGKPCEKMSFEVIPSI